jgi:hypothetical protein
MVREAAEPLGRQTPDDWPDDPFILGYPRSNDYRIAARGERRPTAYR